MRKLFGTVLPLLFFILCVAVFISFLIGPSNHERSLSRGYSLIADHGSWEICDYDDIVLVGPGIVRYAVYDKTLITGEAVKSDGESDSIAGMFVIDMQTRKVYQGLDERKWSTLLSSYGIFEKPRMKHP
jgi:hypothetical protein